VINEAIWPVQGWRGDARPSTSNFNGRLEGAASVPMSGILPCDPMRSHVGSRRRLSLLGR
jgi:hypothetical protein